MGTQWLLRETDVLPKRIIVCIITKEDGVKTLFPAKKLQAESRPAFFR